MIHDDKIYMTKEELAKSSGRNAKDITDAEYEKYLLWTSERW